jgi:hypothetical protein
VQEDEDGRAFLEFCFRSEASSLIRSLSCADKDGYQTNLGLGPRVRDFQQRLVFEEVGDRRNQHVIRCTEAVVDKARWAVVQAHRTGLGVVRNVTGCDSLAEGDSIGVYLLIICVRTDQKSLQSSYRVSVNKRIGR